MLEETGPATGFAVPDTLSRGFVTVVRCVGEVIATVGRPLSVIASWGFTISVNDAELRQWVVTCSIGSVTSRLAVTVKWLLPTPNGVPVIEPLAPRERPAGKDPSVTARW